MAIKKIGDLLARLTKLSQESGWERERVARAVEDVAGIPLHYKAVTIKNGIAFLDATPAQKNKIYTHQNAILARVGELNPKSTVKKIL